MLNPVLTEKQNDLLKAERRTLQQIFTTLIGWELPAKDKAVLEQALLQLDELFLLVIVGEFNAGKSSFINALLGERFLLEGVTPTTAQIHILRHGDRDSEPRVEGPGVLLRHYPADFLRNLSLVDTPGTNAVLREHEQISRDFVPRADLILFVTSADRPFSESEREFLELIRDWGKKVIIVLNKADLLETASDRQQVVQFVADNAQTLLGTQPEIFPVSSRTALRAKQAEETLAEDWLALENYLIHTLNDVERVRLKFDSPLGVAQKVLDDARQRAQERHSLLDEDLQTLAQVEKQVGLYKTNMGSELGNYLLKIDGVLNNMQRRGEDFFDNTFKVTNIFNLMNTGAVRDEFDRVVIADTPRQIENQVQEMIDWMVERESRQWRTLARQLGQRHKTEYLAEAAEGAVGGFEYNRRALLQTVGRNTADVVARYDTDAQARELSESIQNALVMVGLTEVGAIGLGAILTAALGTALLDFTGILAAGVVAVAGLGIIPFRRGEAKKKLREKIDDLRVQLHSVIQDAFDTEVDRSVHRFGDAVDPYSQFVRTEHGTLEKVRAELSTLQEQVAGLRKQIAGM